MNDADLTGRTLGGFRILRKLGAGGMAIVYKAHEGSLNRVVALKIIHEHLARQTEFVQRFQREARAAAQLSHPNIVQIYAVGEDDGIPFFSMEYVKGTSLEDLVDSEGFLTARRAVPILVQAAQALAAAHEAGIVHRDIKPSNIMIDGAGRVKVTDFGIAQVATEDRLTQSGMMVGTPGYTSPEQCLGEKLDARSDIYSLGVTAYEMLTGQTPFRGETPAAVILQIVDNHPAPLAELNPTVPAGLQQIVEKMMHKDRATRFQSAEDVVEALSRADLQTLPTTVQQPRAAPRERTAPRSAPADGAEATRLRPAASAAQAPAEDGGAFDAAEPSGARRSRLALIVPLAAGAVAAIAIVSWRLLGGPAGDGVADPAPAVPTDERAIAEAAPGAQTDEGAIAEAAPAEQTDEGAIAEAAPAERTDEGAITEAAPAEQTDEGAVAGVVTGAPAESLAAARPVATGAAASPTAATAADAAPAAPPAAANAPAPPARAVVTSVAGEYEHVDLVRAAVESTLAREDFEIVELAPRGRRVEDVARFEVAATARLVGSRELAFVGRVQTLYTVSLMVQATDLATGTRAAGPFTATVDYTSINLHDKVTQGTEELARNLVRDLEARLASGR